MANIKKIRSELTIKATAELEEEVLKELEASDPEKAEALETLLEEQSGDTAGDDRTGRHQDDNQGS